MRLWTDQLNISNGWLPGIHLLLIIVLALTCLMLGYARPLRPGIHELRVIETAREMLDRHDMVTPYFNGIPRLKKPPLPYWTTVLAFKLTGESSLSSARSVGVVLFMILLIATYMMTRSTESPGVAWSSTGVLAAGLLVQGEFRQITADPFLAATVTLSIACFAWSSRKSGCKGWLLLCGGYTGLAFALLAKGPIALVFVSLGVWALRPVENRINRQMVRHLPGLLLAALPIVIWTVTVTSSRTQAFHVWLYELMGHLAGQASLKREPWFYLPAMLTWMAPFTLIFLAGLADGGWRGTRWRNWLLFGLLFLSCLSSRKEAYLLPLTPVAAVLIGRQLARWKGAKTGLGSNFGQNAKKWGSSCCVI